MNTAHKITHMDKLAETLREIEANGEPLLLDQATYLLGMYKEDYAVEDILREQGCTAMLKLLPEMEPANHFQRSLAAGNWQNREDMLGRLATRLIRMWGQR